jgi:hypothetical protein
MEKREFNIIAALAVVIVILLGVLVCGAGYFALYQPLKDQQAQLTAIQARLGEIETVHAQLTEIQAALRENGAGLAEIKTALRESGTELIALKTALRENGTELTEIKAELGRMGAVAGFRPGAMRGRWTSGEVAAADSVEGQLRSQGKHWVRTTGEITVGAYVQDILEGRTGQPQGRGAIGKVVSIAPGEGNATAAQVDFGRGYVVGINLPELSLIQFVPFDR